VWGAVIIATVAAIAATMLLIANVGNLPSQDSSPTASPSVTTT
jgi:hypothetical protein